MRIPRYIVRSALSLCGLFGLLIVIGTVQTLSSCDWKDNPDTALATDYYNHTADLTPDIELAKQIWIAENSEFQPNLTAEQEQEVRLIVVKMQSEAQQ